MTPLDRVLDKLQRVKRNGAGWTALCPAHDDHNPSLGIREGDDGKVLLTCYSHQCSAEAIAHAIGMSITDLFPPREHTNGQREIVATYDYTDEGGDLLFQVVRYAPKDFRQRRPDGHGGWDWKLGDTRRVLYRLAKVLDTAGEHGEVFIVEGERDVHAAEAAGVVATCNPGGAGKWRADQYAEPLRGAKVWVVADRDDPGRAHARTVAASLEGIATTVTVVEPAHGKDLADHLAAGLGIDELELAPATVAEVRDDEPTSPSTLEVVELRPYVRGEAPPPAGRWLIRTDGKALLYAGKISGVHGEPSVGKTWIAGHAAVEVLQAGGNVLILDYEDTAPTWVERLLTLGAPPEALEDPNRVVYINPTGAIGTDEQAHLDQILDQLNPTLILVDAAASALARNGLDENSNADVTAWADGFLRPMARRGAAVLVLDHVTKDPTTRTRGQRGAGAKLAIIDGASYEVRMVHSFSRERSGTVKLVIAKDRPGAVGGIGETASLVRFDITDGTLTIRCDPPDGTTEPGEPFEPTGYMEKLSKALELEPDPLNREDTLKLIPGGTDYKRQALAALIRQGYISVQKVGRETLHTLDKPYRGTDPGHPGLTPAYDGPEAVQTTPATPASPLRSTEAGGRGWSPVIHRQDDDPGLDEPELL